MADDVKAKKWQMADGKWQMADGRWQMANSAESRVGSTAMSMRMGDGKNTGPSLARSSLGIGGRYRGSIKKNKKIVSKKLSIFAFGGRS
jgi:hypothetical protein